MLSMRLLTVTIIAILSFGMLSSCKYDDSELWNEVRDHESRITQLEELCSQMNTNISSLQTIVTALQGNDYVTSITPVVSGNETIGYTINFSKSGPVTIYHGEDGKDGANGADGQDGADGKDGHTPVLGVKMTSDGNYYWTIDGEWLLDDEGNKIRANGIDGQDGTDGSDGENGQDGQDGTNGKDGITPQVKVENGYWYVSYDNAETWTQLGEATTDNTPKLGIRQDTDGNYYWTVDGEWLLDDDGNKIRANGQDGVDGSDGANGQDGQDGADGITPQLKIEDGYWYVSYDNGVQWTQLWKATGEDGKDGADGKDGDSMFSKVTYDDDFVYLVLADNTTTLMIPRKDDEFAIIFTGGNELVCSSGETVSIPYTLTYGDSDTEVAAIPHGGWEATVEKTDNTSGNIIVTAPTPMKDGEVIILVSDGKEKTIMRKLLFRQGVVSIVTKSYLTDSKASTIDVELSTNLNYTVSIPEDAESWISVSDIQTKAAMRDDVVTLNIAANIGNSTRTANVSFLNSANQVLNTVSIVQTSSIVSNNEIWYTSSDGIIIEPNMYNFGGEILYNIYSESKGILIFKEELNTIWVDAFRDCSNLKGIKMPSIIKTIDVSAFAGCSGLEDIVLPDHLCNIETQAFRGCESLKELTFPSSITNLGTNVFEDCPNLSSLYCKPTVPPTTDNLGLPVKTVIFVPTESVELYKTANHWAKHASQIVGYDFTE